MRDLSRRSDLPITSKRHTALSIHMRISKKAILSCEWSRSTGPPSFLLDTGSTDSACCACEGTITWLRHSLAIVIFDDEQVNITKGVKMWEVYVLAAMVIFVTTDTVSLKLHGVKQ